MPSTSPFVLACVVTLLITNACTGRIIPYPPGIAPGGAAGYRGTGDHQPSPYYRHPDFYHLGNTASRTILPHFATYQQTTEYTCGPAALLMAANYRGVRLAERTIAAAAGSNEKSGTSTAQLVNYLKATGWQVRSSLDEPGSASLKFLKSEIKNGNPVLVEWVDWAGHWQVVIGYDDMGTPDREADDVLIMADPYDTTDHRQDGYTIVPADRFQTMWFDHNLLPEGQRLKQWIIFDRRRANPSV